MKIGMMTSNSFKKAGLIVGASAVCILAGCASKPTYNSAAGKSGTRGTQQVITDKKGVPNKYQVRQGDTVARIAQRYGLNWRDIAQMNNLNGSYTIYTGQWLTLWTGSVSDRNKSAKASATTTPTRTQQTAQTQRQSSTASVPAHRPTAASSAPVHSSSTAAPFATGSSGVMQFRYPVGNNNPVVRRFGTHTINGQQVSSNGMWFSGNDGDAINAARAGTVIHVDGNSVSDSMIAIQHTDGFVSTYVYVKDARVKNGDAVSQGQRIASMRSQKSGVTLFEFRIARNGVYVDPLTVLK